MGKKVSYFAHCSQFNHFINHLFIHMQICNYPIYRTQNSCAKVKVRLESLAPNHRDRFETQLFHFCKQVLCLKFSIRISRLGDIFWSTRRVVHPSLVMWVIWQTFPEVAVTESGVTLNVKREISFQNYSALNEVITGVVCVAGKAVFHPNGKVVNSHISWKKNEICIVFSHLEKLCIKKTHDWVDVYGGKGPGCMVGGGWARGTEGAVALPKRDLEDRRRLQYWWGWQWADRQSEGGSVHPLWVGGAGFLSYWPCRLLPQRI